MNEPSSEQPPPSLESDEEQPPPSSEQPPPSLESDEEQPPRSSEQPPPSLESDEEQPPPSSEQPPLSSEQPPLSLELDGEVSAKRRKREKKACHVCGKEMDPRSIQRHLKGVHGAELTTSVCVDEVRGIFMVRKSSNGGAGYPVHVQKSVAGPLVSKPFCEDDWCRIYMDTAWRSGMNAVECRHLQQVGIGSEYRKTVKLSETFLLDLSSDGPYKMLKRERIQECLSLLQDAASHNAELIVSFPDGEWFIHFCL